MAIERIIFSAGHIAAGGIAARDVQATLSLHDDATVSLLAAVAALDVPAQWGAALGGVTLHCGRVQLREPDWRCDQGTLQLQHSPLGPLHTALQASFDSTHLSSELRLAALNLASGSLDAHVTARGMNWRIDDAHWQAMLQPLAQWLQPWWQAPRDWQYNGRVALRLQAAGSGARLTDATVSSEWRELNLQNAAGTLVTEKLAADVVLKMLAGTSPFQGTVELHSNAGQALAGPVLLDLAAHPLRLQGQVNVAPEMLTIHELQIDSAGLARAQAEATLALAPTLALRTLQLDVSELQFPAAYTSFLQLPLAATNFGELQAQGVLAAHAELQDDALSRLDLSTAGLNFNDTAKGLSLTDLAGQFHWRSTDQPPPPESSLQWRSFQAFDLAGGMAALQLLAHGQALRLTAPTRVPLFNGALQVQRFDAQGLGSADVALDFDARIDAIGMPQLSKAFGWPQMSGTLSGQLPGLEYHSGTLRLAGDIAAQVFDGTVTASGLQLRDAFGSFPRLSGNIIARDLDLGQITQTFPIGSISGRLDADVTGLELFNWSPVAFDAWLYTSPGDQSRHRISQKAVDSLANLGGGNGGVMAALQSGFLRFFDDFGYDQIGLRCQLRNDVCLMSGLGRRQGGFYIVQGGGVPRLDVIGNSGRVAWTQLVSQIAAAIANGQVEVR